MLLNIAVKRDMHMQFFDVKTAYLYGSIDETVPMTTPSGFEQMVGPDKIHRLQKSIIFMISTIRAQLI